MSKPVILSTAKPRGGAYQSTSPPPSRLEQPLAKISKTAGGWQHNNSPSQARAPALQRCPRCCSARVPAGDGSPCAECCTDLVFSRGCSQTLWPTSPHRTVGGSLQRPPQNRSVSGTATGTANSGRGSAQGLQQAFDRDGPICAHLRYLRYLLGGRGLCASALNCDGMRWNLCDLWAAAPASSIQHHWKRERERERG